MRLKVIGQGPVALAFALFAVRASVPAEHISIGAPVARPLPAALARRVIALSLGSWQLLARIMPPVRAASIHTVEVSLHRQPGRTRIARDDLGVPALGHVCYYGELQDNLAREIARHPFDSGSNRQNEAQREAQRSESVENEVEIVADGDPGEQGPQRDFGQHAVLANLSNTALASNVAYERFTSDGPLALLPLPESGHFSLVWCSSAELAQHRMTQDESGFLGELAQWVGPRLGDARLASDRISAPLQRRMRENLLNGRRVHIGNAAQSLHPVAGQGMNLGLRDAFELVQALTNAARHRTSIDQALSEFVRRRQADRARTIRVTDLMATTFTRSILSPAHSMALAVLDQSSMLRRSFASQLMFGTRT